MAEVFTENRVIEPKKKREMASMFVDVDALREQIEYIRMLVARLKMYPGHDRQIRYFVVLHEMLVEMSRKLQKYKSVRLDFWGQA